MLRLPAWLRPLARHVRTLLGQATPAGSPRIDPDVKAGKLARIRPLLKDGLAYVERPGCLDCLPPALRDQFGAHADGPISSHDYDPTALGLIARYADGLILDCGAGSRGTYYENVVNLEIAPYPSTDVMAVGEDLPFRDASFDAVFSLAVLEHVKNPFRCAEEIMRVLKPGGRLYVVVPFLQHYHGYPHHYYNMTMEGLRSLFEPLEVVSHEVPQSALPIWTASHFLARWAVGLPPKQRDAFLDLTVRDLVRDPMEQLSEPHVTDLPRSFNIELASTTALMARKPVRLDASPGPAPSTPPRKAARR